MATDPREIQLTDDQRKLLAEMAEETGKAWTEILDDLFVKLIPRHANAKSGKSLYDVLTERGMIAALNGPGDLNTNPKHMEGFGEPRYEADSD